MNNESLEDRYINMYPSYTIPNFMVVTFNQAIKLKSQGFNLPCLSYYDKKCYLFCRENNPNKYPEDYNFFSGLFSAPTIYEALIWLMEEKGLNGYVKKIKEGAYQAFYETELKEFKDLPSSEYDFVFPSLRLAYDVLLYKLLSLLELEC